jgi:hypothetical protein
VLVCRYKKSSGPITHVVFRTPANYNANAPNAECPRFFFAGPQRPAIYFADDNNHCQEALRLNAPPNCMFYSSKGDYLVCVDSEVVMYKYVLLTASHNTTQPHCLSLSLTLHRDIITRDHAASFTQTFHSIKHNTTPQVPAEHT